MRGRGGRVEVAWPSRGGVASMQAWPKPRCGEGWKVDGLGTTLEGRRPTAHTLPCVGARTGSIFRLRYAGEV